MPKRDLLQVLLVDAEANVAVPCPPQVKHVFVALNVAGLGWICGGSRGDVRGTEGMGGDVQGCAEMCGMMCPDAQGCARKCRDVRKCAPRLRCNREVSVHACFEFINSFWFYKFGLVLYIRGVRDFTSMCCTVREFIISVFEPTEFINSFWFYKFSSVL